MKQEIKLPNNPSASDIEKCVKTGILKGHKIVGDVDACTIHVRTEYFALVEIEEETWKGIKTSERTPWFGIVSEGTEAPWLNAMGACLVRVWDIRKNAEGVVEYGIGNETRPPDNEIAWITKDEFFEEWPDG